MAALGCCVRIWSRSTMTGACGSKRAACAGVKSLVVFGRSTASPLRHIGGAQRPEAAA